MASRQIKNSGQYRYRELGPGAQLSGLAFAVALAWGAGLTKAQANPTGGVAVAGQATFSTNGNQLLVTTQNAAGANHSAINWQSFSIPGGSGTYFQQPTAASTVINRVVTNTPSQIFGTLGSNGNLVLVNQSGITVGAGAVVDTAGFTASALRMSDADALAGRLRFGDGTPGGGVTVAGSVLARSGDVFIIGSNVDTASSALISAPNGSTVLAAGQQIALTGRGLEGISLEVQAPQNSAVNLGNLKGDAVGIFASTLKNTGAIQATAVTSSGGRVFLKATDSAEVGGTVQAQGANDVGGQVIATANRVMLKSGAIIDASGAKGGGEVLIGGGFHGQDARVANAQTATVEAGAQIKADATGVGNGGNVVVWADGSTEFGGFISARGGANGGNGGAVEVSGAQTLHYAGLTDTRAPKGKQGFLLLDPTDIVISNFDSPSPGTETISNATLATNLGYGSVILNATNDITVSSGYGIIYSGSGTASLTLNAGHDITLNAGIDNTGYGSLAVGLNATNNVFLFSPVTNSSLGKIDFTVITGGSITSGTGSISTGAGDIKMTAGGTISGYGSLITLGGKIELTSTGGAITGLGSSSISSGGGDVKLIASAGSISGSSSFTTLGGKLEMRGATGVSLTGTLDTSGGTGNGDVRLESSAGSVQFAGLTGNSGAVNVIAATTITSSGNISTGGADVSLTTTAGDITTSFIDTLGGNLTISAGGMGLINAAAGYGQTIYTSGGFANLTTAAGDIHTGYINSASGDITMNAGGAGAITVEAYQGAGNSFDTSSGSSISLTSGGITHVLGGVTTSGGNLTISANQGITLDGAVDTTGALSAGGGGLVSLTSTAGGITTSSISTYGYSFGEGANGGSVAINAAGPISVASISSYGDNNSFGGAGNGGDVSIITSGTVNVGSVDAHGGNSSSVAGNGGSGGLININASGDVTVSGNLQAYGGDTSGNGNGGSGNNISLTSSGGGVSISGYIESFGGFANGAAGNGGNAGNVYIQSGTYISLNDYVDASGGDATTPTAGGVGGSGGNVTLHAGSTVYAPSYIDAFGADGSNYGGNAGAVDIVANGTGVEDTNTVGSIDNSAGAGSPGPGTAASLNVASNKYLTVGNVYSDGGVTLSSGTNLQSQGVATSGSASLTAGANLSASGDVLADGAISLSAGLNLTMANANGNGRLGGATSISVQGAAVSYAVLTATGNVSIATSADLNYSGGVTSGSLTLISTNGAVTQSVAIGTGQLAVSALSGVNLTTASNSVSNFAAGNSGTGDIALTNIGVLNILGVANAGGNVVIDNAGAVSNQGLIAASGNVTVTAHSPITVNGAITAGGNVTLAAPTTSPSSNITVNANLTSTGGAIAVTAYNNVVQNSTFNAAGGVSVATTTGTVTLGPLANSIGTPLSYSQAGVSFTPVFPLALAEQAASQTNFLASFLDQFQTALDQQTAMLDDPLGIKQRAQQGIVVEGAVCTP